ncbi:hypothetical protein C0081_10640 [Cohaesibacter celericrescens]|uniref:Uncharacterized protein n=1 Tax=Cohaesibacter celericrescens TaxID=2067669 RepID=A0A2N5XRX2_9HYPH|nr:hypothetical protein C0081_10640 [Cohaesibacter celericrescens]
MRSVLRQFDFCDSNAVKHDCSTRLKTVQWVSWLKPKTYLLTHIWPILPYIEATRDNETILP